MAAVMEKCRLCLKLGDFCSIFEIDLIDVLDGSFSEIDLMGVIDGSLQLVKMAMACASIKITKGDGLSDKICSECVQKVKKAFVIKQQIERADRELRQELATTLGLSDSRQTNPNNQSTPSSSTLGASSKPNPQQRSSGAPSVTYGTPSASSGAPSVTSGTSIASSGAPSVTSGTSIATSGAPAATSRATIPQNRPSTCADRPKSPVTSKHGLSGLEKELNLEVQCRACSKHIPLKLATKHLQTCGKDKNKTPKKANTEAKEKQEKPKKKQIKCNMCIAKFDTVYMLNKHIRVDHAEGVAKLFEKHAPKRLKVWVPCLYCNMHFDTFLKYRNHYNTCEFKHEKTPAYCAVCHKVFDGQNKDALFINHVKKEHFCESETSMYKCRLCLVTIKPRELAKHINAHKLTKKTGKDGANASLNVKKVTPDSRAPKAPQGAVYRCELCPKVFKYAKRLDNHKVLEHSKRRKANKAKIPVISPMRLCDGNTNKGLSIKYVIDF